MSTPNHANQKGVNVNEISEDFLSVLQLRDEVQDSTKKIKRLLAKLYGDRPVKISEMGVSDLLLHVNELERTALVLTNLTILSTTNGKKLETAE